MDQAWALEQQFWEEASKGHASAFYARHMTADGYTIFPSGVVYRDALITRWEAHEPLIIGELSEPRMLLLDGPNVLIEYHMTAEAPWLPNYRAWVTALYTWEGDTWALVMRQHTPEGDFAF